MNHAIAADTQLPTTRLLVVLPSNKDPSPSFFSISALLGSSTERGPPSIQERSQTHDITPERMHIIGFEGRNAGSDAVTHVTYAKETERVRELDILAGQ